MLELFAEISHFFNTLNIPFDKIKFNVELKAMHF